MPMTDRQQQAANARKAKLLEDRRVRDLQRLAEHTARVTGILSQRIAGSKRRSSQPRQMSDAGWSRPDIVARMDAQQARLIPQPTAPYCRSVVVIASRQQQELSETRFLYVMPS